MKHHNSKFRILNGLLVVTFLFGYLEWGSGSSSFLVEAEFEVLCKLISEPASVVHPFTLIPLLGQIMLLATLFQTTPNKFLTIAGIVCLGLLIGLMVVFGALAKNWKILASTIPFFVIVVLAVKEMRKRKEYER
jgi:hypothetical protein